MHSSELAFYHSYDSEGARRIGVIKVRILVLGYFSDFDFLNAASYGFGEVGKEFIQGEGGSLVQKVTFAYVGLKNSQ